MGKIIVLFILASTMNIHAKIFSMKEMKNLAKEITNIQFKMDEMKLITLGLDNYPDNYLSNEDDYNYLRWHINKTLSDNDVIQFNDFNKKIFKFSIFRIPNGYIHPDWYIIAIGTDGSIYFLKKFYENHFNRLLRQKIGKPKNLTDFVNISTLYINTVLYDDYGIKKIINNNEITHFKKKYKNISKPKITTNGKEICFEFFSSLQEENFIFYNKITFENGLIKNVSENKMNLSKN